MESGSPDRQSVRDWFKTTNRTQRVGVGIFVAGALLANLGAILLVPSGSTDLLPLPLFGGMVLLIAGTLIVMGAAPKKEIGKTQPEPLVQRPDGTQWIGAAFLYGGTALGVAIQVLSDWLDGPWWVTPAVLVGTIACWGVGLTLTGSFAPTGGLVESVKSEGASKGKGSRVAIVAILGAVLFGAAYMPLLSGIFEGPPAPGFSATTSQSWVPLDATDVSVAIAGQGPAFIIAGSSQGTSDPIRAPGNATRVFFNTTTDRDGVVRVEAEDGASWRELDLRSHGDRSWVVTGPIGATDLRVTMSSAPTMSGGQALLNVQFLGSLACTTTMYSDGTSARDCNTTLSAN